MAGLAVIVGLSMMLLYGAVRMIFWTRDIWRTLAAVPISTYPAMTPVYKDALPAPARVSRNADLGMSVCFEESPLQQDDLVPHFAISAPVSSWPQSMLPFEDAAAEPLPQIEVWEWSRPTRIRSFREESRAAVPVQRMEIFESESPGSRFSMDAATDPIDGTVLMQGERVLFCSCGLTYRQESVEWLAAHMGGSCVQCGERVNTEQSTANR